MDAGAHAIRRAELGHPDEHINAQFLRPGHIDGQEPVLKRRPGNSRGVTMDNGDKDHERRTAHQECDQPLLQMVEHLVQAGLLLGPGHDRHLNLTR